MTKEQPSDNPFQSLDKSQYRDSRQERRTPVIKLKKSDKAKSALALGDEDNLFAGLMRDSGVTPLSADKTKIAPAPGTPTAHTPAPEFQDHFAQDHFAQDQFTTEIEASPATSPAPELPPTPPATHSPIRPAKFEPARHEAPPRFEPEEAALTLGELRGFAALKAQAKALPRHQEKPAPPPLRTAKNNARNPAQAPLREASGLHAGQGAALPPAATPAATPARPSVPPAVPPAARPTRQAVIPDSWQDDAQEADADIFANAMNGVHTLNGGGRAVIPPPPVRPIVRGDAPADPLRDFMDGKVEFSLEFTDEYLQGHVLGLDSQIINKMKAGEFSSEAHLDLHGLNAAQAWDALVGFFRSAYHRGLRCVLLVPGRGLNSPGGAGVLRERLQTWFTQPPFKYAILAFCTALPKHGGAGAIYVLLRKQKKNRGKIHWDIIPADADLAGSV